MTRARPTRQLGWKRKVAFEDLVRMMYENDLDEEATKAGISR